MRWRILITRKDFRLESEGVTILGDTQEIIADNIDSVQSYLHTVLSFDKSVTDITIQSLPDE